MNTHRDDLPRRINCQGLRTLHALELTLRRHIDDLLKVDCEDIAAAEAIVFAMQGAERSLDHLREVRRRMNEA